MTQYQFLKSRFINNSIKSFVEPQFIIRQKQPFVFYIQCLNAKEILHCICMLMLNCSNEEILGTGFKQCLSGCRVLLAPRGLHNYAIAQLLVLFGHLHVPLHSDSLCKLIKYRTQYQRPESVHLAPFSLLIVNCNS